MATRQYETRGAAKRALGALPAQSTHEGTVAVNRTAAASVSDELRHLTAMVVPAGTSQTPKPSAIRDASRERARQAGAQTVPTGNRIVPGAGKVRPRATEDALPITTVRRRIAEVARSVSTDDQATVGGHVTSPALGGISGNVRITVKPPVTSAKPAGITEQLSSDTLRRVVAVLDCNGVAIEIVTGNIALETAAAIVNPGHGVLKAGGGVSKALAEVAGVEYRKECSEYVRKNGQLLATECYVTGGWQLSAPHVIHVASVKVDDCKDRADLKDKMLQAYLNVLATAVELRIDVIAIPAIGAGLFRVPLAVTAEAAAEAVIVTTIDLEENAEALRVVRFVLPDDMHSDAFVSAFHSMGVEQREAEVHQVRNDREHDPDRWHDVAVTDRVLQDYHREMRARSGMQIKFTPLSGQTSI